MSLSGRPSSYVRAVHWMMQCVPSEIRHWLGNPERVLKTSESSPYYDYRHDLAEIRDEHYTMMIRVPTEQRHLAPTLVFQPSPIRYRLHIRTGLGYIEYRPRGSETTHILPNPTSWQDVEVWLDTIVTLNGGEV